MSEKEETLSEAVDRHFKFAKDNNLTVPDYKSYMDNLKGEENVE